MQHVIEPHCSLPRRTVLQEVEARPGTQLATTHAFLASAIQFVFKGHQFTGGFDTKCEEVFNGLYELFKRVDDEQQATGEGAN